MAGVRGLELPEQKQGGNDVEGDMEVHLELTPHSSTATTNLREHERRLMAKRRLEEDQKQILQPDPFFVIPELVMRETLVKLIDRPSDKFNVSQVSRSAAEPLEETKGEWLFHKIFSVPHLLPYLPRPELLRIRQLDRDCREALDLCLEGVTARESTTLPPLSSHQHRQQRVINRAATIFPDLYNKPVKLHEIVQQLDSPPPFIARRASFDFHYAPRYLAAITYWEEVLSLLDRYGRELRSLHIYYKSTHFALIEMLETVQECLRRTPHLTNLDCTIISQTREQTEDLTRYPSMPSLPNLTRLTSHILKPVGVQGRIFSCYYSQLVSLDASSIKSFLELYDPQLQSSFPNLKYLSVAVNKEGHDQFLFKLMYFTGPLQQVEIRCNLKTSLCISVFLHIMGPFRETLSSLKIEQCSRCTDHSMMKLPFVKTLDTYGLPEPESFDLPHLKTLVLEFRECAFVSYNPLLKLRGSPLHHFEILATGCCCQQIYNAYQQEAEAEGREKLELCGHEGDMYSSNIWRLMPQLQMLNFINKYQFPSENMWGNYRYSRYDYEKMQAQCNAAVF